MNSAHGMTRATNQRADSGGGRARSPLHAVSFVAGECGRSDYHFAIAVVISACDFDASV
jgi:hypothetical protein